MTTINDIKNFVTNNKIAKDCKILSCANCLTIFYARHNKLQYNADLNKLSDKFCLCENNGETLVQKFWSNSKLSAGCIQIYIL